MSLRCLDRVVLVFRDNRTALPKFGPIGPASRLTIDSEIGQEFHDGSVPESVVFRRENPRGEQEFPGWSLPDPRIMETHQGSRFQQKLCPAKTLVLRFLRINLACAKI